MTARETLRNSTAGTQNIRLSSQAGDSSVATTIGYAAFFYPCLLTAP